MSTLYIRLPSRSVAETQAPWSALVCPYAVVSGAVTVARQGSMALADLAPLIGSSQHLVVLLAAADVTLLHVKIPPMSPARLRIALPNLVEDQLMADPADCVMVAGAGTAQDGRRTVAVVQRLWLQTVLQTMNRYGARHVVALPSQLCLAQPDGGAGAALTCFGAEIDLAVRMASQEGIGLSLLPDATEQAPHEVIETLCALVPAGAILLSVPPAQVRAYQQDVAALLGPDPRLTVRGDDWQYWVAGAQQAMPNLASGLGNTAGTTHAWRRWRAPLVLAGLLLLLNIVATNLAWWRLSREAAQLQTSMLQIYKTAYPKETVIVDPMAQMRQKITAAQRAAGQAAPDDFMALATGFGTAWNLVTAPMAGPVRPAIATLEYRDHSLLVTPKAQVEVPVAQMKAALAVRSLSLSQQAPGVWQIRNVK